MDPDDGLEDDGPLFAWLPPDDRLWRHPSEIQRAPVATAPPRRTTRTAGPRTWTVAVVAGVVGALLSSGLAVASGAFDHGTTIVRPVVSSGPALSLTSTKASAVDWSSVDDAIAPSVVAVAVTGPSGPASGSGVLFTPGKSGLAYVLTAQSLVSDGGRLEVTFQSGQPERAKLVGQDPLTGIALLAVSLGHQVFPHLGSVTDVRVATPVLAVGARDSAGGSVFPGSITAEDREVAVADGPPMEDLLAISGPTVPSQAAGGPVVDQRGRVVGITVGVTPVDPTDQGLAFAVPVDVADHVAQQLVSHQQVTHPWLGVADTVDLSSTSARQLGVPGGAQVGEVWPHSPAWALGLRSGDVITSFDGQAVTSTGALTSVLAACAPKTPAAISFLRLGAQPSRVTATVVVGTQPVDEATPAAAGS